jgi:hypothetical protein
MESWLLLGGPSPVARYWNLVRPPWNYLVASVSRDRELPATTIGTVVSQSD